MRKSLHRLLQNTTQAAFNIGDDLPNVPILYRDTKKKMDISLRRAGEVRLNPKTRVYALWQKVKSGAIKGAVVASIMRDHANEFANFDKQAAMLKGKGAA